MSSTHISSLPEEVLTTIFVNLHGNKKQSNLINATLVCKKWNRIISQTHSLMDKLQLKLVKGIEILREEVDVYPKFTRFYRHVVWDNRYEYLLYGGIISSNNIFNIISNLDHLSTLEILNWHPKYADLMENFKKLAKCKALRCLKFNNYYRFELGDHEIKEVERIEFKNLRVLQLYKSSAFVLDFIKCKELDSFNFDELCDIHCFSSDRPVVAFLLQLDRCDEISMEFRLWDFVDDFKPKFLWKKLKMTCDFQKCKSSNAIAIAGMKTFLKASTKNAAADIEMHRLDPDSQTENHLSLAILNSCKKITSLGLRRFLKLPSSDSVQLRDLPDVRKLTIDAHIMQDVESFSNFARKLPNVTQLAFFKNGFFNIILPADAALRYRPFFKQITELTLTSAFLSSKLRPTEQRSGRSHLISNLMCENLISIRIIEGRCWKRLKRQLNEPFLHFCMQNHNLSRIEIIRNSYVSDSSIKKVFNSENEALIGWYYQLQAAKTIEACNLMVTKQKNQMPMNWRDMGVEEIELFGRSLTDAENRFFN